MCATYFFLMRIQFTNVNGADIMVFWDQNNAECSIQSDNINGEPVLWCGVNVDCKGQRAFRMLLDRNKINVLVEILKQYQEKGIIPSKPEEMPGSTTHTK